MNLKASLLRRILIISWWNFRSKLKLYDPKATQTCVRSTLSTVLTSVLGVGDSRASGLGTSTLASFSLFSSGSEFSWVTVTYTIVAIWCCVPLIGRWADLSAGSSCSKSCSFQLTDSIYQQRVFRSVQYVWSTRRQIYFSGSIIQLDSATFSQTPSYM